MATIPELPDDLELSFSRGDLSLLGVNWREIRGQLWRSPYRGVHVWGGTDPTLPRQRALDAAQLAPINGALGGWAAAHVGGVAEIDGHLGGVRLPVPLCVPPQVRRRRGPTITVWRSPLRPTDIVELHSVRLTTPVRTAFDLARHGSLRDAVAHLDVLARGRPQFLHDVAAYTLERPGWEGVPQARRAIALATAMARSQQETALRLFWHLDCGLPTAQVNPTVRDDAGHLLGIADLLDPESGLVAEYDGAHHRRIEQHAHDNAREEWLEDAGLTVVRVTKVDLDGHRVRTKQRLRQGHARAKRGPRGAWTWEVGPLPHPVPHW